MTLLAGGMGLALVRLRRDGQQPLRFLGHEIARQDGQAPQATLWHDLALYRQVQASPPEGHAVEGHAVEGRAVKGGDGPAGYAVAIVARTPAGAARCHAAQTNTLDAALAVLETYDPRHDLCPGMTAAALHLDDPALSPAALVVRAAQLRWAAEDVERRYRIGVGRFLMQLARHDL